MKKTIVTTVVLGLILASFYTVHAQSNDIVVINPARPGGPIHIYADQQIVFRSGWADCAPGFVETFVNSAHVKMFDDEQPMETSTWYWLPIERYESNMVENCVVGNKKDLWASFWQSPAITLDQGEHHIYFYYLLDKPYIDGYEGLPERIEDKILVERNFTIIVE